MNHAILFISLSTNKSHHILLFIFYFQFKSNSNLLLNIILDILNVMNYKTYVVVIPDFKTAMISANFIDHERMSLSLMNKNQIHTSFILLFYPGDCHSSLLHAVLDQ